MSEEKIMCDSAEIIIVDETNSRRAMRRITKDQIITITLEPCKADGFLRQIDTERIAFTLRGQEDPIVYFKHKNKDRWDSYIAQLRKFCHDNHVSLHDMLA